MKAKTIQIVFIVAGIASLITYFLSNEIATYIGAGFAFMFFYFERILEKLNNK